MKLVVSVCVILGFLILTTSGDANADLSRVAAEFFAWRAESSPQSATKVQIHKFNDRVDSYDITVLDRKKENVDAFLARLNAIPTDNLAKSDLLTYRLLKDQLETCILGYPWRMYNSLNPLSFLNGVQSNPERFVDNHPFDTRGDFENYIVRLSSLPKQLAQMKTLFNRAIAMDLTYHNVSVSRLPGQLQKLQLADLTQSIFYKPFGETLENSAVPPTQWGGIRDKAKVAIRSLLNAYADMRLYILNTYMPNTRSGYGVLNLNKGREFYKACMLWHLALNMTAEQVHRIGLEEVARIERNMRKIMSKQGFSGSVREYFQSLISNPDFTFKTGDEVLQAFRRQISQEIEPTLSSRFKDLPGLPIIVKAQPTDGPTGYYSPGTPDGSKPGIFWANVLRPKTTGNFSTMALAIHETSPGHHLQISYAITANTPAFRRKQIYGLSSLPFDFPVYTAYVEGWALYAEYVGEELGLYKSDYDLMGRYSSEMFRACRLVVDTGIHYYGWDKERAIDFFLNYTDMSRGTLEVEVDRYITWPGQALAYKIGEIKIRELRKLAQDTLGKDFDIKEFHAVLVGSGAVPVNILKLNVKEWIETVRTGERNKPCSSGTNISGHSIIIYSVLALMLQPFLALM